MGTWNYRVVRSTKIADGVRHESYAIHETHYDKPDGEPRVISVNPMTTSFDDVDELRRGLTRMLDSLNKPVLNYEDF